MAKSGKTGNVIDLSALRGSTGAPTETDLFDQIDEASDDHGDHDGCECSDCGGDVLSFPPVEVLADVRAVIRDLPPDQPAVQRLRRALLRSWGRYDDALAGLRRRQDRGIGGVADLAVVARLRDVLVRSLKIVRAQSGRAALAYTSGGSVQR